jgi:hypothetical protein
MFSIILYVELLTASLVVRTNLLLTMADWQLVLLSQALMFSIILYVELLTASLVVRMNLLLTMADWQLVLLSQMGKTLVQTWLVVLLFPFLPCAFL